MNQPVPISSAIRRLILLSAFLLAACPSADRPAVESVRTDLRARACREEVDRSDPNETPYRVCRGVAGYSLIVRHVDAGRLSIDVVDPAHIVHPLDYQEIVTRHMNTLGDEAEWRVATRGGKRTPIAVVVPVQAREDVADPERVTRTYLAVAKITRTETCVTDRIPEGPQSEARVRRAADSAPERPCARPQPPLSLH